jgi:hypothetical protein
LATGLWLLATGLWLLATGFWQLAFGNWPLAISFFIVAEIQFFTDWVIQNKLVL